MHFKVKKDGSGIHSDALDQFEKDYELLFPAALRNFYIEHNGAEIEEGKILCGSDEYGVVSVVYPSAGNPSLETLIEENRKYKNYSEDHIPFAADWGDDLYCWDRKTGAIWLYFPDDDEPIPVAESIDRFFSNLIYQEEGNKVAEQSFLPLGSVVILKGGVQKVLIISRALNVKKDEQMFFFDYGGVPYPEGLVSDQMAYFNADAVNKVVFEGYRDEEDEAMQDNIRQYLEANPGIVRGDPGTWGNS